MAPFTYLLGLVVVVLNAGFIYYCIYQLEICTCKDMPPPPPCVQQQSHAAKIEESKPVWTMKA